MKRLNILLRIAASGGILIAIYFSLIIVGMGAGGPNTPLYVLFFVGLATLLFSTCFFVFFPLWALKRIKMPGKHNYIPAILYGTFCLIIVPPLGTLLGVLILLEVRKIKKSFHKP